MNRPLVFLHHLVSHCIYICGHTGIYGLPSQLSSPPLAAARLPDRDYVGSFPYIAANYVYGLIDPIKVQVRSDGLIC